jgi:hypothetical protein
VVDAEKFSVYTLADVPVFIKDEVLKDDENDLDVIT